MTAAQILSVGQLMSQLTQSMALREVTYFNGKIDGRLQQIRGIVNRIEIESGSGLSYNVELSDGRTAFVQVK